MIWGKGDKAVLPAVIGAINKGKMQLIGGGMHHLSTSHVLHVGKCTRDGYYERLEDW